MDLTGLTSQNQPQKTLRHLTASHNSSGLPTVLNMGTTASGLASGSSSSPAPHASGVTKTNSIRYRLPFSYSTHAPKSSIHSISPRTSMDTDGSGSAPTPFVSGSGNLSSERSGGGGSTANRLETSKFILTALQDVDIDTSEQKGKGKEVSVPLGDAARCALGVLEIIRENADDNVDENLALLALDSCGLVYIVINSCKEELERTGGISSRTKIDLGGLTSNLNAIQTFVHKYVTRSFAKRVLKHGEDNQMVMVHRQKLKYWMTKFLGNDLVNETMTIHDALDRLVQQQFVRANTRQRRASTDEVQVAPPAVLLVDANDTPSSVSKPKAGSKRPRRKKWMTNKPLPLQPFPVPDVEPDTSDLTPPTVRVDSPDQQTREVDGCDFTTMTITHTPIRPLPKLPVQNVLAHSRTASRNEQQLDDAELRRKERLEREKAQKMAERARWVKSEEEFNKLPLCDDWIGDREGDDAGVTTATSSPRHQKISHPLSLPQNDWGERAVQDLESERVAAELHRKTQRELAEQDEKEARILAAKLEAEDRRTSLLVPARRSVDSEGSSMYYVPQSPRHSETTRESSRNNGFSKS